VTLRLLDRLSGVDEARAGPALLGRFVVCPGAPGGLFMNSFPADEGMFLVPEAGGRWRLLRASERVHGIFPRVQMLDPFDASSIRTVGRSLSELIAKGGTWLDVFDVSPLVPGMSNRAEFQAFEQQLRENASHLEEICRRPHTHLSVEVERMAVSLARRFPPQAANYLGAHTEDWERPTLRSVVPKRILATVREEEFDTYENRVAVRLVDHLVVYLRRRVYEVSRLLRVFEEAAGNHGSAAVGSHWRQGRIYKLWGETLDASEAKRKAERTLGQLKHLLFTISGLKSSVLYREVPRSATVGATLTMTNILRDNVHYRRVADLWLEWARLGQEHSVRPRAYFDEMQELCHCFDSFALLLTLRALDQLGFEPRDLARALSAGDAEVHHGSSRARVSWSVDGTISLLGETIEPLRIVPFCSSLALLDGSQLHELLTDVDAHAAKGTTTVILYPSPLDECAFKHLAPALAARLRSLAHEVGQRRVGFLPVSPWDIGSVERMARQLRWVTTAPTFLAYPQTIARPELPELSRTHSWFEKADNGIRVLRAPMANDLLPTKRFVDEAAAELERLEDERENVSLHLRQVHRGGGVTAPINARKKALNADIIEAEKKLVALRAFERDLSRALAVVGDLLICPTCNRRADAQRDFKVSGQRFSCSCLNCSTAWGTRECGECGKWIPTLLIAGAEWRTQAGIPGWVDRTLGADVLAVPWIAGSEIGFACPSCGDTCGDTISPTAA
jgi:hypothetical protein